MPQTRLLTLTSAFALLAGPALADLTAEQVLADQLRQIEMSGLTTTLASQTRVGDTLTVGDITMSADIEGQDMSITMAGASFVELGDGSVRIDYPTDIPIRVKFNSEEGEFNVAMMMRQDGLTQLVSGIPEQIRYEYGATTVTISDVSIDGPEMPDDFVFDLGMTMSGISGTTEFGAGTVRDYSADFAVQAFTMMMNVVPPADEGEGSFDFDFSVADMAGAFSGAMTAQTLETSMADAVMAGSTSRGSATHGAVQYSINVDAPDGAFQANVGAASGDINFSLDKSGLSYGGSAQGNTITFAGDMIPLPPLSASIAETGGQFDIPVVPGDAPQDFRMAFNLSGLELDDTLWNLFDPGAQLPRDPATLSVDVSGVGIVTEDFTATDYGANGQPPTPGTLEEVTINSVELTIAGASLTGDGAFEFNNDMGIPLPNGTVNMMLTGGNGLLDTLVAMGFVPEEQAMGARMMLGLFARPGTGPDSLVSTIEVKEDGSILANGQRIK